MVILTHATGGVWESSCLSAYMGLYSTFCAYDLGSYLPSFPPFVSNSVGAALPQTGMKQCYGSWLIMFLLQRHVTRQKILNWKQSLRFPSRPRVSHEGVALMQQLLCEPEDRLGSQASASVSRPNSMVTQARRSSFIPPPGSAADGADLIKVQPHLSSAMHF